MKSLLRYSFESFLSVFVIFRAGGFESSNMLLVLLFFIFFIFYKELPKRMEHMEELPRIQRASKICAGIFSFLYLAGDFEHLCEGLTSYLFCGIVLLFMAAGLFVLFSKMLYMAYALMQTFTAKSEKKEKKFFSIASFVICLLAWMPYLLMNYPSVMTPDSLHQYAQVIGVYGPSNHHPWVHTRIIYFWYKVGLFLTGDKIIALSFYTVFQMIFMAGCVSYLVKTLQQFQLKKWILICVIFFYAFIPYQGAYVVTMWKDILFSGSVLVYVCALFRLLQKKSLPDGLYGSQWTFYVSFLAGVCMCLFRTNGYYAYLLMLPFIIYIFRFQWRIMLPLQGLTLLLVLFIKGPVMDYYGVVQPDLIESLSIPSQQIARVFYEDGEISKEQKEYLENIMNISSIKEYYNPYNSGGFKRLVREGNQTYLYQNLHGFLAVWRDIGMNNPRQYLIAYRDQTISYWYPLTDLTVGANEGIIDNDYGLSANNYLGSDIIIKCKEILFKLQGMIPIYGILFSTGAIFWIMMIAMGAVWIKGQREMFLLFLPNIAIFITLMVASPLAKEFRYAYALVYCMPVYLIIPFLPVPRLEEEEICNQGVLLSISEESCILFEK